MANQILSDEELAAVIRWHAAQAEKARTNLLDFYEYVIKEETSREPIEILPFQVVALKFIEHYNRFVLRIPIGFTKSYMMAAISMFRLGKDNTDRGVIISATEGQSQKPVRMVSDYIETSEELHLVFPELRRSPVLKDSWTQTKLVVDRPRGIRDPSLMAAGLTTSLPGARLSWILLDDILNQENSASKELRDQVKKQINTSVFSRRDVKGSSIGITNTPWHPEDITYTMQKAGWPTLEMDAQGNIRFFNANDFDCIEIRPSDVADDRGIHRLTGHDRPEFAPVELRGKVTEWRDLRDEVPLWPQKFPTDVLMQIKDDFYRDEPWAYEQLYNMKASSLMNSSRQDWIEACKKKARERGIYGYLGTYNGGLPTVTGVDLGIGPNKKKNAKSSLFTFNIHPDGHRQIIDIDAGHFTGAQMVRKIAAKRDNFNSIIGVESNAAQDLIRQWALEYDISIPVRARFTGKNKHDPHHGVETILFEVENGAWLIPNDQSGRTPPGCELFVDDILNYNRELHTGDVLMSCWVGREQARAKGYLKKGAAGDQEARRAANMALLISQR